MDFLKIYNKSIDWLVNHGPNFIAGILILLIGLWLINFLKRYLQNHMNRKQVHSSLQPFLISLTITALNVLLFVVVMQIIGFELTIFTAVIGAFSVAAGLALSGTLQNFAGGVLILLLRPFELDDNIIAQGQDGVVTSIQIFYTELLTFDNRTVIIPNGKLFNEVIVNVSRQGSRRLDVEIKLNYGADVEQVKQIINQSIDSTEDILTDPVRFVGIKLLEADGMRFTARVWVNPQHFLTAKLALQERMVQDLKQSGIKLPGM